MRERTVPAPAPEYVAAVELEAPGRYGESGSVRNRAQGVTPVGFCGTWYYRTGTGHRHPRAPRASGSAHRRRTMFGRNCTHQKVLYDLVQLLETVGVLSGAPRQPGVREQKEPWFLWRDDEVQYTSAYKYS